MNDPRIGDPSSPQHQQQFHHFSNDFITSATISSFSSPQQRFHHFSNDFITSATISSPQQQFHRHSNNLILKHTRIKRKQFQPQPHSQFILFTVTAAGADLILAHDEAADDTHCRV
jgi:hypothetical protein